MGEIPERERSRLELGAFSAMERVLSKTRTAMSLRPVVRILKVSPQN